MSTEKQTFSAGQMLNIGGALLKAGSTLTGHDGKQVILQKQGNQQQIVTLVKTNQGMPVATVPKSTMQGKPMVGATGGSPQIIQTHLGSQMTTTMAGATIVKLVNAPGAVGGSEGQSPKIVKTIGCSNMVTLAKHGQIVGGKQTIVINKPGAPGQTISMPGSQKTFKLSASGGNKGGGQIDQTRSGQTIQLPADGLMSASGGNKAGGQIDQTSSSQIIQLPVDGLMSGGKPVTVQTLVQAPQNIQTTRVQQTASLTDVTDEMIQMPSGPGGDSPAQNAVSIEIEEHNPPQLYDGITIPPNELEDISEFGMLFSQVDGGNDDSEKIPDSKDSKEANPATSTEDTSTVV